MASPIRFGYRAVAEQYPPIDLLDFAARAEREGFEFVTISDHFHPWFHKGGHAAFAWTWIASALERTKKLTVGTGVTTPIHRYHPGIIAQAFATLGSMYTGRLFLGLGTGEAMNEFPIGQSWPPFKERAQRIEESIKIIRRLWTGSFVTFRGKYFSVTDGNLYEKPTKDIPIYLAASGPTMAEMAGKYADGLYTTPSRDEVFRDIIFPSMKRGAMKAKRNYRRLNKMILCNISWDEDYDKAVRSILRWRVVAYPNAFTRLIWDPRKLDELGKRVPISQLTWRWVICTNLEDSIKRIEKMVSLGFNEIEIRSCSPNERGFIRKFGRQVLPYLREKYA